MQKMSNCFLLRRGSKMKSLIILVTGIVVGIVLAIKNGEDLFKDNSE